MTADRYTLNVHEVAVRLGVSSRTVYGWCERGVIPHLKIGQRVLIPVGALEEWMGAQTHGGEAFPSGSLGNSEPTSPSSSRRRARRKILSEENW